jgi:putative glycosyltransferase (TIGR04372 family)
VVSYFQYPRHTNAYLKFQLQQIHGTRDGIPARILRKLSSQGVMQTWVGNRAEISRRLIFQPPNLPIQPKHQRAAEQLLTRLGICVEKKWIALCVRDEAYTESLPGAIKPQAHRNSPIELFENAVTFLLEEGHTVIRMGRKAKEKLKIVHPRLIDYPFVNWASDFMDIFLIANSNLIVSTSTGLDSLGHFYKVPIAFVNTVNTEYPEAYVVHAEKKIVQIQTGIEYTYRAALNHFQLEDNLDSLSRPSLFKLRNLTETEILCAVAQGVSCIAPSK